jgi:hypothetical protein
MRECGGWLGDGATGDGLLLSVFKVLHLNFPAV